jgi:predicted RNA-binding protein Jag
VEFNRAFSFKVENGLDGFLKQSGDPKCEIKAGHGEPFFDRQNRLSADADRRGKLGLAQARGQTLDAMQYIVRRIVGKKFPDFEKQIIVNTESYRERKRDNLEMMAKRIAKQVRSSQREETLHPMNAFERRIVHVALENESGVVTRSQGEGIYRCIVVYPDAKKGEGSRRDSETATSENH